MITTEIKATLTAIGAKFTVKFEMDITDHMAREIVFAVADLFNDQPDAGKVIRTEKAETALKNRGQGEDQSDLFRDEYEQIKPTHEDFNPSIPVEALDYINAKAIEYDPHEPNETA